MRTWIVSERNPYDPCIKLKDLLIQLNAHTLLVCYDLRGLRDSFKDLLIQLNAHTLLGAHHHTL